MAGFECEPILKNEGLLANMIIFTITSVKKDAPNITCIRRFYLVCLLFFMLTYVKVHSQDFENFNFENVDEKDGLYSHWITNIAFDSIGYLWIGSNDGLNRYDGHSCKLFKHNSLDSNSLLHDNIREVHIDKSGRPWITYAGGGLSMFDQKHHRFIHYTKSGNEHSNILEQEITLLLVENERGFWFSTLGKGLCFFDFKTSRVSQQNLPEIDTTHSKRIPAGFNTVAKIYEDDNKLMWLCTINGLYSFNSATGRLSYKKCPLGSDGSRNDCFIMLVPEKKKGFWLASIGGGIVYYDIQTEKFTVHKYNVKAGSVTLTNNISFLANKGEDELWVGSGDRGLGIFDKLDGGFKFWKGANSEGSYVSKILFTPSQVMFVLENFQLLKYNPFSRLFYFKKLAIAQSQGDRSFIIRKIVEDSIYNSTYFATDIGDGLVILNHQTGLLTSLHVKSNPQSGDEYMRVNDIIQEASGRTWVLSRDYLYELDRVQKKLIPVNNLFKYENPDSYIPLRSFAGNAKGNIYIVTVNGGLYPFSTTERKLLRKINDTLQFKGIPNAISYSTFDRDRNLWVVGKGNIGFFDSSLVRYTPIKDSIVRALGQTPLTSLVADTRGNVWIACNEKGILKLQAGSDGGYKTKFFSTLEGLPTNKILSLNIDHNDNLWMNSINGVIYMNTEKKSYRVFSHLSGIDRSMMMLGLFNGGNNSFYLSSLDKYCKVDFSLIEKPTPIPKIYIDKFRVFDVEKSMTFNEKGQIVLQPNEDFFSFEYGCVDYMKQSNNQFAYMLEGWDRDWIYCGTRRYTSYTNLKGGNYVFKVKVANIDGIWSEPASVAVFLETPFYKKNSFKAFMIFLFACIIYALYHYRVKQIENAEKIKTAFNKKIAETRMEALRAQMNPHFIFNCLNSINRYIVKNDIKTSSLYLTRFAKLMRLVLDNSKHKKITLAKEIEALKLYIEMERFRFEQKFSFSIDIDNNVEMDTVQVPPLIIQPYVENAIWHGLLHKEGEGTLQIAIKQTEDSLLISIQDNGIGRVKAQEYNKSNEPTRKSMGMKLTEERLQFNDEIAFENASEIIDLYDAEGTATGTLVKIKIYF